MNNSKLNFIYGLCVLHFLHHMDNMVIMPLSVSLTKYFEISAEQYGDIVTFYMLGAFLSTIIGYKYLSNMNKKVIFLTSNLSMAVILLLCIISEDFYIFLFLRFSIGFCVGLSNILLFYFIGHSIPAVLREKAISLLNVGYGLAIILGIPFSVYFTFLFSWKLTFILLFLLTLLISFYLHSQGLVEKNNSEDTNKQCPVLKFKTSIVLSITFLTMIAQSLIVPYMMIYFKVNLKGDEIMVASSFFIGGLLMTIIANPTGQAIKKYGSVMTFHISSCLMLISIFFLSIVTHQKIMISYLLIVFFILTSSSQIIVLNVFIVANSQAKKSKEKFLSLISIIQYLSLTFSAWIATLVIKEVENGEIKNYNILCFISITTIIIAMILISRKQLWTKNP